MKNLNIGLLDITYEEINNFIAELTSLGDIKITSSSLKTRTDMILGQLVGHIVAAQANDNGRLDLTQPWSFLSESEWFQIESVLKSDPSSIAYLKERYQNKYWNLQPRDFELISQTKGIKQLILDRVNVNDSDLGILAKNKEIEHLSLRSDYYDTDFGTRNLSSRISDRSLKYIGRMKKLHYLDLWGARIHGIGLENIEDLTSMRYLDLGYTFVIGSRLRHLTKMKDLESLNLVWTRVDDRDLDLITGLAKLSHLNLQSTKITNEAISRLEKFSNLQSINVSNTAVTSNGVKQLRKNLPNLEIIASHLYPKQSTVRTPPRNGAW